MARPAPRPRKYEMMIVVAPTVTEEGLPAVVERVSSLIEAQDGEVESFTHNSPWGHRRLAYPIQNFRDAFYVLYYFHAPPRAIVELDRELRLDSAIIRHLIVKFDPLAHRAYDPDTDDEDEDDDVDELAAADADEFDSDDEEPAEPEVSEDEDSGDSDETDDDDADTDDDVGDDEDDADEDESDDEPEEADDDSDADETEHADDGEEDEEE